MAREKTEAQKDRYSRFGAPKEWIAATVIGTGSAATTFINLVRTKFHQDAEFRQGFSLINLEKNEALKTATDEHLDKVMGLFERTLGEEETFKNFKKERGLVNQIVRDGHAVDAGAAQRYDTAAHKFFEACQEQIDKVRDTKQFKDLRHTFIQKGKAIKVLHDDKVDRYSENMFGIFSKGLKGHTLGSWQRFQNFSDYAQRNVVIKTGAALAVAFGGTMMVFNQLNTRDKLNEIDKQSESADRKLDAVLAKVGIGEHEIETREEHRAHVKEREKAEDRALRKGGSHTSKVEASRDSKPLAINDNQTSANDNEHEYRHAASLAAERDAQLDAAEMSR